MPGAPRKRGPGHGVWRVSLTSARGPHVLGRRYRGPVPGAPVWKQREIRLEPRSRGFHLIDAELGPELAGMGLSELRVGLLHLHLLHTSASLALNENASPDVRRDLEAWFSRAVPEHGEGWTHTLEGADDMPAHVKSVLIGPSLTLPVASGQLALGTWQGVYLCEHRDRGGPRTIIATLQGEPAA